MTKMCCVCHRAEENGEWLPLHPGADNHDTRVTHGYCPECFAATMGQLEDFIGAKAIGSFAAASLPPCSGLGGPCV